MTMARFPQNVYATRRNFNDYGADDMRYGDITEKQLKNEFKLTDISNIVDPYTLTRLTIFNNPRSRFTGIYGNRSADTVSVKKCAKLLFDEMRINSWPFSMVGPYRYLINLMIEHLMNSSGTPFRNALLDQAYRNKIVNDNADNIAVANIKRAIDINLDFQKQYFPQDSIGEIAKLINGGVLPKFDSLFLDKINGMGISVHDIHATRIDVLNLDIAGNRWRARVKFMGQDHFGLDVDDIRKQKFYQFQFFKIWFVLQRYNKFGFRPFLTDMEAIIDIEGGQW